MLGKSAFCFSSLKKLLSFILFLFLLSTLSNCVSIKSVRDPNFNKKISKVFVEIDGSNRAENYFENLKFNLNRRFYESDIESIFYMRNALSLDSPEDKNKQIAEYQPDVIFYIIQTSHNTVNGVNSGGVLELTLVEPGSDKPVWKAVLEMDTGGWGMGDHAQVANKIFEQLRKDGIIPKRS